MTDELCWMPAVEAAGLIAARKLSPVELLDAVLARVEKVNPRLNAYCTLVADAAREQARAAERGPYCSASPCWVTSSPSISCCSLTRNGSRKPITLSRS